MIGDRRLWYLELVALASLAALLVVLAVLQYRWLGALSDREAESRQTTAETALAGARASLESVIATVREDLRALAPDGVLEPEATRREDLRRLAREPAVAAVFWIARDQRRAGRRAMRLTPAGFQPAAWSEVIQSVPDWAQSLALRGAPPVVRSEIVQWIPATLRSETGRDSLPGMLLAQLDRSDLQRRIDRSAGDSAVRLQLTGGPELGVAADRSPASIGRSVDALRHRNLLLSGGILSLLAASAALLWLVSQRAARLSRERLELVAGVSHELRTPVAVIRSAAANLSDGIVGEGVAVREYGALIGDHAERLQRMVEQALDLSRATRRVGAGRIESANLHRIVTASVGRIATLWPDFELRGVDSLAGLPAVLMAPDDLEIVVDNLLSNAARYSEGGRWAQLQAKASGDRLSLSVTNPAQPLAPGELDRLFQPFFRGRRARELNREGSGLGLMLVRTICERYGGRGGAQSSAATMRLTVELPI
ncbi:MAG: sensor histidine kinase [Gammaproteobacteria bacterium]